MIRSIALDENKFKLFLEDESVLADSLHLWNYTVGTLSGSGIIDNDDEKRFRYVDPMVAADFYEMQVSYEMEIQEGSWRIVAHGPNVNAQRNSGNELIRVV